MAKDKKMVPERPAYAPGTFVRPDKEMVHYRDGKFYEFRRKYVAVTRAGERGTRTWIKTAACPWFRGIETPEHGWFGLQEYVDMLDAGVDRIAELPYTRRQYATFYRDGFSPEICRAMLPYHVDAWAIGGLCLRTRGLELAATNPGVALLVARNRAFMGWVSKPWERARRLVLRRRRDILALAHFPESESTVRILAKIPPSALNVLCLRRLGFLLKTGEPPLLRALQGLPALSRLAVDILTDLNLQYLRTPAMLALACAKDPDNEDYRILRDTMSMTLSFSSRLNLAAEPLSPLHSLRQLRATHDRLITVINGYRPQSQIPFPEPPFPDMVTEGLAIEYLRTPAMLYEWGEAQRNCAASYHQRICAGTTFLYRVLRPEPATLSLKQYANGAWVVDELKATCNQPVRKETTGAVRLWMRAAHLGLEQFARACPLADREDAEFAIEAIHHWPQEELWARLSLLDMSPGVAAMPEGTYHAGTLFWMSRPEPALLVMAPDGERWKIAAVHCPHGRGGLSCRAHAAVRQWLWENARTGDWHQLDLPLVDAAPGDGPRRSPLALRRRSPPPTVVRQLEFPDLLQPGRAS